MNHLQNLANILDVEPAAIAAVKEVESNGSGHLKDGRLKILFEGHIFWKQIIKYNGIPATYYGYEDVLYKTWTRKHYKGGAAEWDRMSKALKLCEEKGIPDAAALNSASYGTYQIMGFNHTACGYHSAHEMLADFNLNPLAQDVAFVNFIKANRLDKYLRTKDWAGFARWYNGPGYKTNKYDEKLATAYKKHL